MLTSYSPSGLLYRLSRKRLSKEAHKSEKKVLGSNMSDGDVHDPQLQLSYKKAAKENGEFEKLPAPTKAFPAHFQELMPTTRPFNFLRSFERELDQRIESLETTER